MRVVKGLIYGVLILSAIFDAEVRPMMMIALFIIASYSSAQDIQERGKEKWQI